MKKILFIIFLLGSICYSQNNEILVEYDVYYNTSSPRVKKSFLGIFNRKISKYIELPEYRIISNKKDNENTTTLGTNYQKNRVLRAIEIDKIKNNLTSIETIVFDKKTYKTKEKIPVMNWEINYPNEKKIGNYVCNKATLLFRGRKYIVWYAKDLPIPVGPWKFNGTPGLILEAYDETLKYRWIIKKIKQIDETFNTLLKKVKYDVDISLKEFVKKKYSSKNSSKIKNKIESKLPRGTFVEFNINKSRQGRELIYDWES